MTLLRALPVHVPTPPPRGESRATPRLAAAADGALAWWYACVPPRPVGLPAPRVCSRQALRIKENIISGGSLGPSVLPIRRLPLLNPLQAVPAGHPWRFDNNRLPLSLLLPLSLGVPHTHVRIVTARSPQSPDSASIADVRMRPSSTRRLMSGELSASGAPKNSA